MGAGYTINTIVQAKGYCPERDLKEIARRTLRMEGVPGGVEVNVLLTDDRHIRDLNKSFMNRNRPTDVIAFSAKQGRPAKRAIKGFIGDIAISAETAASNAKRFHADAKAEIFLCLIHGLLHLLGYEDETKEKRAVMEARQERLLKKICAKAI